MKNHERAFVSSPCNLCSSSRSQLDPHIPISKAVLYSQEQEHARVGGREASEDDSLGRPTSGRHSSRVLLTSQLETEVFLLPSKELLAFTL
jgi:hypothetical protein